MGKTLFQLSWGLLMALSTLVLGTARTEAADRIVFKYKIFEAPLSVQELTTLVETGEVSPELQAYFSLAEQDPQQVRKTLNQEIQVSGRLLDRTLNHPLGEVALDRLGEIIQTPAGGANRQALRSALVLSALPDDKLTLLEVIQKYPTSEVHVDGERLVEAVEQISRVNRVVQDINDLFQGLF